MGGGEEVGAARQPNEAGARVSPSRLNAYERGEKQGEASTQIKAHRHRDRV